MWVMACDLQAKDFHDSILELKLTQETCSMLLKVSTLNAVIYCVHISWPSSQCWESNRFLLQGHQASSADLNDVYSQGPVQRALPAFKLSSPKSSCPRIDLKAQVPSPCWCSYHGSCTGPFMLHFR